MEAIRNYVEALFSGLPKTQDIVQMKLDMLDNLAEKYQALLDEGKTTYEATGIVISSIGTAAELRAGLDLPPQEDNAFEKPTRDPKLIAEYRAYHDQKAGMIAIAVALFICSPIMYQLFKGVSNVFGQVAMFSFIAMGVALCILSDRRDSYYRDMFGLSDHNTEFLSEWLEDSGASSENRLTALIATIIFPAAALIYLCMGFLLDLWHPGWLIFVACGVVVAIISALEQFKRLK